ncbi:MAG: hypothetical protein AAFP13_13705 [Pseudomonadota bacterium]
MPGHRVTGLWDEEIVALGHTLFIHFPSGMGRSALRLPGADGGTMRNLTTLRGVADLCAAAPSR